MGTGRVLRTLFEKGCQVTGVDISAEMLEAAEALLTQAGFRGVQVTHEYAGAPFPPLEQAEATESPFVCMAKRPT